MQTANKTADPKKYIREYMKARYAENPEQGATTSRINYYKRQGHLTKEESKKYGELSPYIAKAKKTLDTLKSQNQQTLEDFLFNYLEQLDAENL
mgnify:CR=1 FL=1|tara:strand:+ start:324 stop:605 length:282 start_codon:yes stop_codon:yes gene_type:complete